MERRLLDKIDFNILTTLARDCRTSYSSMGSMVGLTSKSVKARVKNMIRSGVIEKFIVRVNPEGFGSRTARVLVTTNKGVTKDDVIRRVKQFGDLAYHVHHMGRSSVAALIINKSLDNTTIRSLNDALKPATVSRITVSKLPVSRDLSISDTDLRIIRCLLLLGARAEISEIANELGVSEKTTTRRLDRMKEDRLLEFSIQCDPASMIGYVQFAILINFEKSYYRSVNEGMYSEFQKNILYVPSVIDPNDWLIYALYGENVFAVDSVLAKVESFDGVKSADVYVLIKWQYYDDWIIRQIDQRLLLPQRPISDKSKKESSAFREDISEIL
jgi:DNA-binding Lrp family transcriptional regulator